MGNTYTVTATSDDSNTGLTLTEAINEANANPGSTIDFSPSVFTPGNDTYTLTGALPEIKADVTIDGTTTDGQGITLDGGGKYQGFYVYSGTVTVENLTLDDTAAIGQAGSNGALGSLSNPSTGAGGGGGGGGGAGLGGGLLVGARASVTLSNVAFEGDLAIGGNGGFGGGINIRGPGGSSAGGSGGGFEGGVGGSGAQAKGAGGSAGGFGAGGGGGAGSNGAGGGGGFGGGGGGGGGFGGSKSGGPGSTGGFGAGSGLDGAGLTGGNGGGGLGAGGDIFVEQGGSLTIDSGSLAAGTVVGGSISLTNHGFGFGSGIFLQGDQSVTFAPATNQTVTISGVIADQSGSADNNGNVGTGSLIMDGTGTLVLAADNTPGFFSSDPDNAGFTGGITIEAGTVDLTAVGAAGSGPITFDASGDPTLEFTPATAPTNAIDNFGPNDNIQIDDFLETSKSYANGVLTLTGTDENGTSIPSFSLDIPGQALADFQVNVGSTDTVIDYAPCYCPGTLIRTPRGQKKVEKLKIGDKVTTVSGAARPIKWIGRRSYLGRFVMGRKDILPVCIKAGALEDNVPKRDLWISPNHALYLDGMLIEAKDLINGVSIVQAQSAETVEYIHIELETHDVIIAEGALAESYIDDDNRLLFQNAHEYRERYPQVAIGSAQYCAPRCDEGFEVETVRRRIALRAGLTSNKETMPGALRGFIDRVTPDVVEGWAQNLKQPEAPVCLDIHAGGQLIGQVLANRYRADLKQAGMGSGCHSFIFTVPDGIDFAADSVAVQRSLDGKALLRSAQAKRIPTSITGVNLRAQQRNVA
jgi:hypothetical protein